MEKHQISERRACRAIGQPRNTQRYKIKRLPDEDVLTHKTIELANQYGCYGPKMITGLLNGLGMQVNHKLRGTDMARAIAESTKKAKEENPSLDK